MKKILSSILCIMLCGTLLAGCGGGTDTEENNDASTEETDSGKYRIAVSNAFMGNDWRQLMIKCLEVAAEKEPYKDKIDLTIVNSENSPEAQSSAIDALVEEGYDAILVDASSATALQTSVNRALQQGITVVSFDSVIDMDGVYTVQTDLVGMAECWAEYLCEKLGDGAKVAVDTGMPGSTNGNTVYEAIMEIMEEHNMEVVAEFASEYTDGVCQEQLASVLAANPDLEGILCQAYVESCYAALTQAGMDLIPVTAYDTNLGMITAVNNDMDAIIGNNCPGLGVIAMDVAMRVLDGEEAEQDLFVEPGMFVNEKDKDIELGIPTQVIELGVNCWEDQPDGLDWPLFPTDFTTVDISVEEISDFAQN